MKLTFLGTRGEIEGSTKWHRMHSSLMVSYQGIRVMVDCGADWLGRIDDLNPRAIVITHAHPDHAGGLREGAPCPVYAPEAARHLVESYGVQERRVVEHRKEVVIRRITFEAFPVEHSTRAPAVGYRISAGRVTIFYAPDVVYIHDRKQALSGARLYVGDGATVSRSMVQRRDEALIGRSPIRTQLTWCQKEGVQRAIFTHCGSEIVGGDERKLALKIREMAEERGVQARIATDGMEIVMR